MGNGRIGTNFLTNLDNSNAADSSNLGMISDKFTRLKTCQAEITNLILKVEDAEQAYEEEFLPAEKYRDKYCCKSLSVGVLCEQSNTQDNGE
ncbi:hypothetical protein AVEN_150127-1 [Araneus ventricosus]|uniref:Uncharacterized protein n=1 Tax=Araneus ventricosus TaxID=182803 RepID=A0A4Y2TAB3_ARAVE|nr:hypothetical protein AVEN_150127-1 [Araneus ventricosus]